jgi:hypothetical protein
MKWYVTHIAQCQVTTVATLYANVIVFLRTHFEKKNLSDGSRVETLGFYEEVSLGATAARMEQYLVVLKEWLPVGVVVVFCGALVALLPRGRAHLHAILVDAVFTLFALLLLAVSVLTLFLLWHTGALSI